MAHPIYRITSVEYVMPYALKLRFNDGLTRTIDFEPILEGELYGPLRDPLVFAQVTLDPEIHTVIWPSGADFDPATLHDWPEHEAAFRAAAKRWSQNHADAGEIKTARAVTTRIDTTLYADLAPLPSANVAEEHQP